MIKIIIIIAINYFTISHNYSISLNYPFLISNQSVISYMKSDLSGNYILQLGNRTVVKYSPTLTAYQTVAYPTNIEKMGNQNFQFNVKLQNGTLFRTPGIYQSVIYNNSTSLNFHDDTTGAVLSSYNLNDTILSAFGFAAYVPNTASTPHNIIIGKGSVKVIYQSQIYTIYDNYSYILGSNVYAVAAQSMHLSGATNLGWLNQTYNSYISTSNYKIYCFTLTVNLLFNETTQILDYYSTTATYALKSTCTQAIEKMIYNKFAQVIIMQSPSNNFYFYNIATSLFGKGSTNLTSFVMRQLFNNSNNLYILSTTGLIQINLPANSLYLLSVPPNLLPTNNYELVFGNLDLLYIISGPNVYKAGLCLGQFYQSNSSCISYNCTMGYCNSCPINNQTCGTCNSGHMRNVSFLCNFANSSATNITDQTNTNQTKPTNKANQTKKTNQTSQTTPNQSPKDQTDQIQRSFFSDFVISVFLLQLLNYFLTFLQAVISVPGARSIITPAFYLFGNFDNLFLYQFHDRTYSPVVNDFFNQLNKLEIKKWGFVNTTSIISNLGNIESFNNFTNFQQTYQQFNYAQNTLSAGQSQGLFFNSQDYFMGVLPIIFVYFCIFHGLFRLLYQYSISKLFRNYQFWLVLFLYQLEGNVQQLTFYLSRQWVSIYTFSFPQTIVKISVIYYGFALIFMSCSIFYLFRWFYKSKIRLILQNCKNCGTSIVFVTVEFGIQNIYFGALSFFGRYISYSTLMQVVLSSEIIVVVIIILLLNAKLYKNLTKTWLAVLISLLRILFIISLLFDYQNQDTIIQQIQLTLILLMIVIFCGGIVFGVTTQLKKYVLFFIKNCNTNSNQQNDTIQAEFQQNPNQQNDQIWRQCITSRKNGCSSAKFNMTQSQQLNYGKQNITISKRNKTAKLNCKRNKTAKLNCKKNIKITYLRGNQK